VKRKKLISDRYYKSINALHETKTKAGKRWGPCTGADAFVESVLENYGEFKSLIDYGCGQGNLGKWIEENCSYVKKVVNYDPGVKKFSEIPRSASEVLFCTDVLEHVEPDLIDNVLRHIDSLYTGYAHLMIASFLSKKNLTRISPAKLKRKPHLHNKLTNVHLIIEDEDWWIEKIEKNMPNSKIDKLSVRLCPNLKNRHENENIVKSFQDKSEAAREKLRNHEPKEISIWLRKV
jgi:hypothetical protein